MPLAASGQRDNPSYASGCRVTGSIDRFVQVLVRNRSKKQSIEHRKRMTTWPPAHLNHAHAMPAGGHLIALVVRLARPGVAPGLIPVQKHAAVSTRIRCYVDTMVAHHVRRTVRQQSGGTHMAEGIGRRLRRDAVVAVRCQPQHRRNFHCNGSKPIRTWGRGSCRCSRARPCT
jgi:hypothetical protein